MPDPQPMLFPDAAPALQPEAAPHRRPALFHDLDAVQYLLLQRFGPPEPREVWDPLTQLIYSICSSRTKDAESHAVLRALRERYDGWPSGPNSWDEVHWERLRDAPVKEIEETIHLATFPDRKAVQLKQTLERITERVGTLSMQWLAKYRTEKIRTWIEGLPGAGSKASAAVANFSSLRRSAMAIDAHHQRIMIRMGVAPANATPRQVEELLMPLVPATWTPATMDDHHVLVKKVGQTLCTVHQTPCKRCPLRPVCETGMKTVSGQVLVSLEPAMDIVLQRSRK